MRILVFNAGSSSLKFGVFLIDPGTDEVFKGSFERFRDGQCDYRFRHGETDERGTAQCCDIGSAMERVPDVLKRFGIESIDAIGHRVAHGGSKFAAPAILDDANVNAIQE